MKPPYYAVIFTNKHSENTQGYYEMSEKMESLAKIQPGYLGIESARDAIGITVSYWESLIAIQNWKQNFEHQLAQNLGRSSWYDYYRVRICLVERDYSFETK